MEGHLGQIGRFGKLPRRLCLPDGEEVGGCLRADAVVGQDVVRRLDHVLAREDWGFAALPVELEGDELRLQVAQDLDQGRPGAAA